MEPGNDQGGGNTREVEYEYEDIGQVRQDGTSHELVHYFERHEAGNSVDAEKLQHPALAENLYYPPLRQPHDEGGGP
jgi:hypothetical protein